MRFIIDPPAHIIKAPTKARYKYQQELNVKTDWTTILNRKHPSGRICLVDSDDDDLYTAISISPYHELFDTQIEDGIKDIVYAFINKNYMPISSCEGHDWSWDSTFVKLAVTSMQEARTLGAYFASIPYVTVYYYEKSANNEFYEEDGVIKVRVLDPTKYDAKSEADSINRLYFRSHTNYCFLHITLFEYTYTPFWSSLIRRYIMRYNKSKHLKSVKLQLLKAIQNLPFHEK
jgi:hypothetical protein